MTGSFGGYGSFVTPDNGRSTYAIIAAVDGKPTERVKIIAYSPGCQIETLDIRMQSQTVSQQLLCVPLPKRVLRGQFTPATIAQQTVQVEVTYLAMWVHQFFGIADGLVTAIPITTGIPDQNGNFEVTLPDFSAQANLGEAEFMFTLREIKTKNIIAFLNPVNGARPQGLKVEASYPQLVRFSSMPR